MFRLLSLFIIFVFQTNGGFASNYCLSYFTICFFSFFGLLFLSFLFIFFLEFFCFYLAVLKKCGSFALSLIFWF